MGIDRTEHSPGVQQKIVYAGRVASSFASAAELLEQLAGLPVPTKQVERLTRAIGTERVALRDAAVAAFAALPLAEKFAAPKGVASPELACVFVDGGRLQVRERCPATGPPGEASDAPAEPEQWDEEPAAAKGFWREDKLGLLAVLHADRQPADPCPEVPAGFLDVLRVPILVKQLGKVAAGGGAEGEAETKALAEEALRERPSYQPPEVKHRQVVGSCRPWSAFARVVAQAAWAAGLQRAKRKAFVADGSADNWRLRARFFGSFTAVLDFIHAVSYVYAAALAGRSFKAGWRCYQRWISWVWKGEVKKVLGELTKRQEEVGQPEGGESETSVPSVVARALVYLSNHQDKMNYAEYRKEGLPITSSVMESTVKQINYRVKGTEKFWCQHGAEAIVQLRADHLSDDAPLDEFFHQRQAQATGQRPYRRSA